MTKKVAIITGGSTGIGRQVALELAKENETNIVIAGRDEPRGITTLKEIESLGGTGLFVQTNVGSEADVKKLIELTVEKFGRVDFLFNNAGIEGVLGPLEANSEEVIDEVLATNIKGVLLCIKHVLPIMVSQQSGIIINTASFVGTTLPLPVAVVYGASKAAVISITQSVAASCADQNVKVYAVCPWVTDTPMVDRLTGFQPGAKADFGASINPSGVLAKTEDIASYVLALLADQADLISGEAVLVDSGASNKVIPMTFHHN